MSSSPRRLCTRHQEQGLRVPSLVSSRVCVFRGPVSTSFRKMVAVCFGKRKGPCHKTTHGFGRLARAARALRAARARSLAIATGPRQCLGGTTYLNAHCQIRPQVIYVLFVVSRIIMRCCYSPRLKNTSGRQVEFDKWFPLKCAATGYLESVRCCLVNLNLDSPTLPLARCPLLPVAFPGRNGYRSWYACVSPASRYCAKVAACLNIYIYIYIYMYFTY